MERVFGKDRGSMGSFFRMLQKARLPYLWILAYIAITALLTNVGINVTEYTAELFAGNVNFGTVVLPFLAFTLLSQLISSVSKIMSNLCVARIDRNIRKMIWSKTVRLPLRYYEKNNPKEMISRITTDITAISQLIMQVFVAILTSAYTLVITLRKIGSYDQKLMIALIVVLPLNLVIAFVMGKMKFGVLDLVNQKNAELTQTIAEKTNNLLLIKSYGKEEKELQTGQEKMKGFYKSSILNAWLGFVIPSEVSYVALGGIGEYTGEDYLLGRMVSFDYLWAKIRAEGGAYGCQMSVFPNQSWIMSSYRDPNVKRTIEAFRNTSRWLEELELGEQELLNYKIGAVAGYDRTPKTYVQAKRMDSWYLRQEEPQVRAKVREGLLKASEEDLKNRRQAMESFAKEGTVCVLGNRARIEEAADQFDNVTVLME